MRSYSGRRHVSRVPRSRLAATDVESVWRRHWKLRASGGGSSSRGCLLAAAYLATRLALLWRFPWYVDETTFASFARDVHGDLGQFFAAEIDKKGLLPSWLGAGLITAGFDPVTAMRVIAGLGAALAAVCGGLIVRRLYGLREGLLTAALIALGPYFLVNASVGIYDALVTGLVAAAILVSIRLAQRPRLATALGPGRRHRRRRPDEADDLGRRRRAALHAAALRLRLAARAPPAVGVGGLRGARGRPRLRHHVDRAPDPALRPAHAAAREPPHDRPDLRRARREPALQRPAAVVGHARLFHAARHRPRGDRSGLGGAARACWRGHPGRLDAQRVGLGAAARPEALSALPRGGDDPAARRSRRSVRWPSGTRSSGVRG